MTGAYYAAGRQVEDGAMEKVMQVHTTEEEHVKQPARPGGHRQPAWQLDGSATATWRSHPTSAEQQHDEASVTSRCILLGNVR